MSIDLAEAIEAGLNAIEPLDWTISNRQRMEAVLTAALPHIEQQIREQVAAEIEADRDMTFAGRALPGLDSHERSIRAALNRAATIARTPKETDHA